MSFIVRIATLYRGDPTARNTPWVQVILRCENPIDRTNCVVEQHTGTEKQPTNPDAAEAVSAVDGDSQFDELVRSWERKGFRLRVDHKFYPG
jgi:hypothetical protein